jgi:hypothetical protein
LFPDSNPRRAASASNSQRRFPSPTMKISIRRIRILTITVYFRRLQKQRDVFYFCQTPDQSDENFIVVRDDLRAQKRSSRLRILKRA